MTEHINLFGHGDKPEVYAALQRDYKRDQRYIGILDIAWVVLFLWWSSSDGGARAAILFFAIGALAMRFNLFIDNSNRNWSMHVIDWFEQTRRDRT